MRYEKLKENGAEKEKFLRNFFLFSPRIPLFFFSVLLRYSDFVSAKKQSAIMEQKISVLQKKIKKIAHPPLTLLCTAKYIADKREKVDDYAASVKTENDLYISP